MRGWIFLPLLAGCIDYGALLKENPKPGGTVTAALDQSDFKKTTALGHAKAAPFVVEGASEELTFSATLADDAGGADAFAALSKPGGQVTIQLGEGSTNHLEVHLLGTGCIVDEGVLHLFTDEAGHLSGDFNGTGPAEAQGTNGARCAIDGTLAGIPVTHDE